MRTVGGVRILVASALAILAGLMSCSDDFGPSGGTLPLDVSQDSVAVRVDPPLAPIQELVVEVEHDQAYDERPVLYFGSGANLDGDASGANGWLASPLIRFDFSTFTEYADTLDVSVDNWESVEIVLQINSADDVDLSIERSIEVFDLADTLRATDAEVSLMSVLGSSIRFYDGAVTGSGFSPAKPFTITLANPVDAGDPIVQMVDAWLQAGFHRGVGIVETSWTLADTTTLDDSIVRVAGDGFTDRTAVGAVPGITLAPILKIQLVDDDTVLEFTPLLDLTHLEVAPPPESRLQLSSSVVRRNWFEFALPGPEVPGNATINQATLVLTLDPERQLAVGSTRVVAYLGTFADASQVGRGGSTVIVGSAEVILAGIDERLEIDVTETAQQAVNGLLGEDAGILLALDDELGDLTLFHFYGSDAPADSLKPHIDLTFTPPADFVE